MRLAAEKPKARREHPRSTTSLPHYNSKATFGVRVLRRPCSNRSGAGGRPVRGAGLPRVSSDLLTAACSPDLVSVSGINEVAIVSAGADPPDKETSCDAKRSASGGVTPADHRASADPAKRYVMSCLAGLVLEGIAEWDEFHNGDIELRFKSGERYILGVVVTRTA
jgi:hypothetical protein